MEGVLPLNNRICENEWFVWNDSSELWSWIKFMSSQKDERTNSIENLDVKIGGNSENFWIPKNFRSLVFDTKQAIFILTQLLGCRIHLN